VRRARGGVKRVGSASTSAARVLDGSDRTFWEPDSSDGLDDWWIELDLGRLVSATRIVVRFAESTESRPADPFLQFRVHTATGQSPFGSDSGAFEYEFAGGTTLPNRTQREFEFSLEPTLTHSAEWTGRLVQYVRLAVSARRGARGEVVTQEAWEALSPADRGTVENIWLIAGEQRLVTAAEYEDLPTEEQGGRRYFRRERPRLAEVEVWTAGNNVALGIIDRGGSLTEGNENASPELAFDGNVRTNWNANVFSTVGDIAGWGLMTMDLGALLRLDAVRFITRRAEASERVLYGYELRGSDGSRAPDGSLIWESLSSEDRLLNQDTRLFEDQFEPRPLRFLEFHNVDVARRTQAHLGHRYHSAVTEIQVYAAGHPPEVVLESPLIDMSDSRSLRTIDWEADTPTGTRIEIRTRTGNDLRSINKYFLSTGEPVDSVEYHSKPSFFQGDILTETIPGPGWSNWSQPYLAPGESVLSPSPRRYMMIQARLLSDLPDTAATLRSIQVNTLPPLADRLLAEITPNEDVAAGQSVPFDVYLEPTFSATRPGFDLVRLTSPSRAPMRLRSVSRGTEAQLQAGTGQVFERAVGDSLFRNADGATLQVRGDGTDTLQVRLPTAARGTRPGLVHVAMESTVYQSGSTFGVEVARSVADEIWQAADPGDVVGEGLSGGSGLTVLTPLGLGSIQLDEPPGVFTPNGDGIRDVAQFAFTVLNVNIERRVSVEIYDLRGQRLRMLEESRASANGAYLVEWDGLDEAGSLVAPGIYVARIKIDADRDAGSAAAVLCAVAY
jgi:hypothetical protein